MNLPSPRLLRRVALRLILLIMVVISYVSCATNTADAKVNRRNRVINALGKEAVGVLGRGAYALLVNSLQAELSGQKIDYAHAATADLYAASVSVFSSGAMERVIAAASDDQLPQTQQTAAKVFASLAPTTPAERQAVVSAIANTISAEALKKG